MDEVNSIRVRLLEPSDLPIRVCWMNDERIYRQMPLHVPVSLSGTQKWFSNILLSASRYDFAFVNEGGSEGQDGQPIAMGGLVDIDHRNSRAELYIMVDPSLTGKGVGTRVLRWLCNFGFGYLNLNRIYLFTLESNERARSFYEKNGFVFEGVLRKHAYHLGRLVDRYVHAMLRDEWKRQPWYKTDPGFKA